MPQSLSKGEVHQLLSLLNSDQRDFIEKHSKQNKKSKWIEAIARRKGIVITEETSYEEIEPLIDDWILVDVLDSGFGNRDYYCECGRPLRYQYRVLHKKERKVYGYGSFCFEHHTNLSPDIVKEILRGFHTVDLERDEILIKYSQGDFWDLKRFIHVETIPDEILEQDRLGLPLTDHQRTKVTRLAKAFEVKQLWKQALSQMDDRQKKLFQTLRRRDQREIVQKLNGGALADGDTELPIGFKDEEVLQIFDVGLPLLDRHLELVENFLWEQNRSRNQTNHQLSNNYTTTAEVDYQTVIARHLDTLKSVRANEEKLSEGLKRDWKKIEDQIRSLKAGKEFDYSSFKLNLSMICYALHIE